MAEFARKIFSLYPNVPPRLVGFTIAKCDKGRKIIRLRPTSTNDLERSLGRGRIVIVPNRDIPLQVSLCSALMN